MLVSATCPVPPTASLATLLLHAARRVPQGLEFALLTPIGGGGGPRQLGQG